MLDQRCSWRNHRGWLHALKFTAEKERGPLRAAEDIGAEDQQGTWLQILAAAFAVEIPARKRVIRDASANRAAFRRPGRDALA